MSYLDNLENNLKALEKQEERDPEKVKREQERREAPKTWSKRAKLPELRIDREEVCRLDRSTEALTLLERLAVVNPDDLQLREFIDHGTYAGQHCNLHADSPPAQSLPAARPLIPRSSR